MSRVTAVQMASGPKVNANLLEAERLISTAAKQGADLVVLPENFALMGNSENDKVKLREVEGDGQIQTFLSRQAAKHGVWLVGGTIPLVAESEDKIRAASLLYNDKGEQVARYDKIHLFDVHIEESDEHYVESETIEAGDQVVVVDTPFGRLGLTICYDLRFPELFRAMLDQGVELIAIPSAFTAITGKAHWTPLVRSRAIENLSYVIAAAQGGYHASGRETHGDSMVVDPWGVVLDHLPRGSGVVVADVDLDRLRQVRERFPAIEHRRI
ncbi:acyltransferase [Solemya pervernicosa gill symbiont]|uniref:Acyltransferase n=2 Tax=Gammaproteobacteria incertae sedis TaxID=118884 RepID=A0A1T2L7G9_9GAMM|nr:carbon-nitrogen hydrolase family protein [Candidatus Reidiella endopervernicosa]OOZ40886.1 acyltransferase [Solemya pervernicosa gill symbiont]QKQ26145.1 carbon-nitrogen hydrolase family protein [Candidatus Reidiella endopervernicosa]